MTYEGGRVSAFIDIQTGLFNDSSQMYIMSDAIIYACTAKYNILVVTFTERSCKNHCNQVQTHAHPTDTSYSFF